MTNKSHYHKVPLNFTLNGLTGKKATIQVHNLIETLNTKHALNHIGGMLFKSNFNNHSNTLHLGFVPAILEGERSYHYNIHLEFENEYNILGVISATGEFKLLLKPKSAILSKEDNEIYLANMSILSSFLIENEYKGEGELDWATREVLKVLMDSEKIPSNLFKLAKLSPNRSS